LRIDGGRLLVPAAETPAGAPRRLRIAAGDVSLARQAAVASSILNVLPVRIVSRAPVGASEVLVVLALGADGQGARLLARVTRRSWDQLGLAEGLEVLAQVKGVALSAGPQAS
jgi:molybdate transport system ATP-binding protein